MNLNPTLPSVLHSSVRLTKLESSVGPTRSSGRPGFSKPGDCGCVNLVKAVRCQCGLGCCCSCSQAQQNILCECPLTGPPCPWPEAAVTKTAQMGSESLTRSSNVTWLLPYHDFSSRGSLRGVRDTGKGSRTHSVTSEKATPCQISTYTGISRDNSESTCDLSQDIPV